MRKRLSAMQPLRKQMVKFTLIGILAVATDLIFYYLLLNALPDDLFRVMSNEVIAKTISFICGVFVTYNLNKFWTWRKTDRSNRRFVKFIFLYTGSLALNVLVNSGMLYVLHGYTLFADIPYKYFVAFAAATSASAAINFVGQKIWVFRTAEGVV